MEVMHLPPYEIAGCSKNGKKMEGGFYGVVEKNFTKFSQGTTFCINWKSGNLKKSHNFLWTLAYPYIHDG